MRADADIRCDVESQLQRDANIDDSLIGVIVRAGIVTLTGEAGHYGAKWAAEEAAKRVPERAGDRKRNPRQAARARSAERHRHRSRPSPIR